MHVLLEELEAAFESFNPLIQVYVSNKKDYRFDSETGNVF